MEKESNTVSIEYQEDRPDMVSNTPLEITDVLQIKRLVHLIDASDIDEIKLRQAEAGLQLVLRRLKAPVYSVLENEVQEVETNQYSSPANKLDQSTNAPNLHHLRAQMVGVFHPGLKPHNKALIAVGDYVKAGQAVGTIEALSIFNEVETAVAGRVVEISIQNGQRVEYGQLLMTIELPVGKTF